MRTPLPMYDWCSGCGKCCESIGMPPFEVRNPELGITKQSFQHWHPELGGCQIFDTQLFMDMPAGLRAEHAERLRRLDRDPTGTPCIWLDTETKRCLNYEWRPGVCRIWTPRDEGCRAALTGSQVVWLDDNRPWQWRNPRGPMPWWVKIDRWLAVRESRLRTWLKRRLNRFSLWRRIRDEWVNSCSTNF